MAQSNMMERSMMKRRLSTTQPQNRMNATSGSNSPILDTTKASTRTRKTKNIQMESQDIINYYFNKIAPNPMPNSKHFDTFQRRHPADQAKEKEKLSPSPQL
jgi:hypothetical protein